MIKVTISQLERQAVELEGEEPAELLGVEPTSALAVVSPVRYRLICRLVSGNVLAEGNFSYRIAGCCGRCVADVEREIGEPKAALFFDEIGGDELDLTDAFREEALLALPVNLLCDEDCRGLCPRCGCNLNEKRCDCVIEKPAEGPSAWSALDDLNI
ncbi:MAG: DUF177 domain-containing protein [Victivallaceae bacterium]